MGSYDFPPTRLDKSSSKPSLPWVETPLIYSPTISRHAGCNIYLKLENLQPSGSFKSRGIGNLMLSSMSSTNTNTTQTPSFTHFYCSSGGNAGLACATTALSLSSPSSPCHATIVVPNSTSPLMISHLRSSSPSHVTVIQTGDSWAEADSYLRENLLNKAATPEEAQHPGLVADEKKVYVPPFDHPLIWEGCTSMVDELAAQFPKLESSNSSSANGNKQIDGIVCSVGGGGLVNGICLGVEKNLKSLGGRRPKILAVETVGADSLFQSVQKGELLTLDGISSIATSLGARRVSQKTWELANGGYGAGGVGTGKNLFVSATVTDKEAAMGCIKFLDDARILVEVACGATVVTAYNGDLRRHLGDEGMSDEEWAEKNIVLVVCGGSNVNLETLGKYREVYGI